MIIIYSSFLCPLLVIMLSAERVDEDLRGERGGVGGGVVLHRCVASSHSLFSSRLCLRVFWLHYHSVVSSNSSSTASPVTVPSLSFPSQPRPSVPLVPRHNTILLFLNHSFNSPSPLSLPSQPSPSFVSSQFSSLSCLVTVPPVRCSSRRCSRL